MQADKSAASSVAHASSALHVPLGAAHDLVSMGKIIARGFTCKLRVIDPKITPHNHLIIGLAPREGAVEGKGEERSEVLLRAYERAHRIKPSKKPDSDSKGSS